MEKIINCNNIHMINTEQSVIKSINNKSTENLYYNNNNTNNNNNLNINLLENSEKNNENNNNNYNNNYLKVLKNEEDLQNSIVNSPNSSFISTATFDANILNFAKIINPGLTSENLDEFTNPTILQIEKKLKKIKIIESSNKNVMNKPTFKFISDNSIYSGDWNIEKGKREGFGIYIDKDGNKYTGHFLDDYFDGRGRLIDTEGNYYEGNFKKGKANGVGMLKLKNGYKYIGEWLNDLPEGIGKEFKSNGDRYEGEFKGGFKEGKGDYYYNEGEIYNGNFEKGKFNGNGKFQWKNGKIYIGEWRNNEMNGNGIFKWPNGRIYKGEYKNNKKEGNGIYFWNANKYYEGSWVNNLPFGLGALVENGVKKVGIFRYGRIVNLKEEIKENILNYLYENENEKIHAFNNGYNNSQNNSNYNSSNNVFKKLLYNKTGKFGVVKNSSVNLSSLIKEFEDNEIDNENNNDENYK